MAAPAVSSMPPESAIAKAGVPESEYPPKLVGFTPEQFGLERVARKGLQRLDWEFDRYQPYALAVYNGRTKRVQGVVAPHANSARSPERRRTRENGDSDGRRSVFAEPTGPARSA